jgi:glycine oxidase
MSADYIIVGGGIIGLFTAWALAEQSANVVLLERGSVGKEASWAGAGILSPLRPWAESPSTEPLTQWSQTHYPLLATALFNATGIDPEWIPCGALALGTASDPAASAWAERNANLVEHFDTTTIAQLEPALALASDEHAFGLSKVAQVRNPRLLRALRLRLEQLGVTIREHQPVTSIVTEQTRVSGVLTAAGERISSHCVVVAAGAWSTTLLTAFGSVPAIQPVRGQMLLYRTPQPLLTRIVLDRQHYLVPRPDGHLLVGSTLEYVGYDARTTASASRELQRFATRRLSTLSGYSPIGHWAGLRPGSVNGVPTIGPHPEVRGLYANFGHFRNGVTLAPASARLLANLIVGIKPIVPPDPYRWPVKCG